jgi:hypothetical protein
MEKFYFLKNVAKKSSKNAFFSIIPEHAVLHRKTGDKKAINPIEFGLNWGQIAL